jgi:hypothetical protein
VVKPGANIIIQYSDKTKAMAEQNPSFSANDPERMRRMVLNAGFTILEEDLTTICHSNRRSLSSLAKMVDNQGSYIRGYQIPAYAICREGTLCKI